MHTDIADNSNLKKLVAPATALLKNMFGVKRNSQEN